MKIFVAGPLNSDAVGYIKNLHNMIIVANEIRKKGHQPYVPCFVFMMGLIDGNMNYEDYFNFDYPWLDNCDAIYFIDNSQGADKELKRAKELKLIIFRSLEEIPNENKN